MIVIVVITVMVVIVVTVAAVDVLLGAGTEADQHVERQAAIAGFDDFYRWRQLFGDFSAHPSQIFRAGLVGFVEDDQVSTGQLIGEQFVQRRLVIKVRIEFALGIDLIRERCEGASSDGRAVDHGDHRVNGAGATDFRPLEGLHQRLGQGQARGFNKDVVEIAATGNQFAHYREEFFLHRAAQAAVGQLIYAAAGLFFGAADGALLEDLTIDAELAKLVDDHRDAPALSVIEHVSQQRGFARTEETGDDGDGEFGQCFHRYALWQAAGIRDENRQRACTPEAFATGSPRPVVVRICDEAGLLADGVQARDLASIAPSRWLIG